MAETGNICIFRDGVETSAGALDKIDFDGDSATPDARSHIETYNVTMTLVTQENPVPDSNNPSGLQDTGLAIVQYEITGFFDGTGGTPLGIRNLRNWLRQDKTSTSFPFGRFGIRNDQRDEFDVVPQTTQGLMLEHFETNDEYEYTGRTGFTVRLRFNGDISGLG
jgi:hypothetical protein